MGFKDYYSNTENEFVELRTKDDNELRFGKLNPLSGLKPDSGIFSTPKDRAEFKEIKNTKAFLEQPLAYKKYIIHQMHWSSIDYIKKINLEKLVEKLPKE